MNRRHVTITVAILVVVASGVAAWYVFLVIEPFKRPGYSIGSIDEGKPWNYDEAGQTFEGARLIAQYFDVYRVDHGPPASHNWLYQVLIVFPRSIEAEDAARLTLIQLEVNSACALIWPYRFDGGEDEYTSINLLCKDVEGERRMLIEDQRFQLRQGNLFCVFLNQELKLDRVEQLSETITRKATIADFKRLLPNNPAVQATREFDGENRSADRHNENTVQKTETVHSQSLRSTCR